MTHPNHPQRHPKDQHLSFELKVDYVENDLSPEMDQSIQEHLAACSACAEDILAMTQPPPVALDLTTPLPKTTSWEEIVAASDQLSQPTASTTPGKANKRFTPLGQLGWWVAAASLFLAAWVSFAPSKPAVHAQVTELFLQPQHVGTRGSSAVDVSGQALILRLSFAEMTQAQRFTLSIASTNQNTPTWQGAVSRQPDGSFLLSFDAGYFTPGSYSATLSAANQTLATYSFNLQQGTEK